MKSLLLLGLILTSTFTYAKGITVEWACPKDSPDKKQVNVLFDDQGKLQFKPDVFSENIKSISADDISKCIAEFQSKVNAEVLSFRKESCPSSKDDFCYASVDYANSKVLEKINSSNLVKKNSSIKVSSLQLNNANSGRTSSGPSTAQAYLEEKIAKKEIDPKKLNYEFNFQGKSYKVSDFDKVVGENVENVFTELSRDEAKQYAQNYMVAKASVLNSTDNTDQRKDVMNNLNQMFGYIYGEKGPEELAKILECKPEDELKPIDDILKKLNTTQNVSGCAPLEPGQHKIFSKDNSNYYSTANYTLKREADGNYQAVLNVDFSKGGGSVSPTEMLNRARNCLAIAAPHMKSPDGKTMELVLLTPGEISKLPGNERPKPNKISIEVANYGTNAAKYAENVNCATITHEMLHLLGLCDEYKEDRPEYAKYSWNCRVVSKAPSIMRDLGVFDKAVGGVLNCNCAGETCSNIMKASDEGLKTLYTSETIYDAVDFKFRNAFCKEDYISSTKSMGDLSKALLLQSESANGFVVESRFVNQAPQAPYYKVMRSKVTCNCPAGNSECLTMKNKVVKNISNLGVRRTCPQGASYMNTNRGDAKPGVTLKGDVLTMVTKPQLPSLLQPNHFNKILEGNCPGKSKGYQECAEFAYKSQPCNVPAKCNDDKYYLGSEQ